MYCVDTPPGPQYAGATNVEEVKEHVVKLKSYRLVPARESGRELTTFWHGRDERTGQAVRCRIIDWPEKLQEQRKKVYRRRAQKLAGLTHSGIAPILDVGELESPSIVDGADIDAGALYIVCRVRDDELSVTDTINELEWDGFSTVLVEVLRTLAFAHSRDVIDGHLRPGMIMYQSDVDGPGEVEIRDFGLIPYGEWSGGRRELVGFEAPEVRKGVSWNVGPHSDLYSLGVIAFRWLYGHLPRRGEPLPGRRQQQHFVPTGLAHWIEYCLQQDGRDRFSTAAEARDALEVTERNVCISSLRQSPMPAQWRSGTNWKRFKDVESVDASWWWRYRELYPFREPPMIGRQKERDQLWNSLYEVERSEQARAIVIDSAVGLGGRHLAKWIERRARELGAAQVLRATHSRVSRPTDGLGPMIGRFLGCNHLREEAFQQELENCLQYHQLDLGSLDVDQWAGLLGSREAKNQCGLTESISPAEQRRALRHILEQISSDGPLVIRIDDAHWASETLDWVEEILESPGQLPILFVVVSRRKELAARPVERVQIDQLTEIETAEVLEVEPLEQAEIVELLMTMAPLEEELAYELAQRTAGSPLFAIQLLRYWVERDFLQPSKERAGRLELAATAGAEIPEDVVEVWTRELESFGERFGPEGKEEAMFALEVASALGTEVSFEEWTDVCERLDIEIPDLMVRGLFATRIASEVYEEGAFVFEYSLVREVLQHRSRSLGRHKEIHEVCVQMLADRDEDGVWTWPGRKGTHLFEAEQYEEALEHLIEGSIRLGNYGDSRRAMTLLARYHQCCDQLGLARDDRRRIRGWLRQAWSHRTLGDREAVSEMIVRVRQNLRADDEEEFLGALLWLESGLSFDSGQLEEAGHCLEKAREHFEAIDDLEGLARTELRRGSLWRELGRLDDARTAYVAARGLFETLDDPVGVVIASKGDATVLSIQGAYEEAEKLLMELTKRGEDVGPVHMGDVYNSLGELYRAQRQWTRAEDAYRRAMELWTPIRQPLTLMVRINLAMTLAERGDYLQAEKPLDEAQAYLEGRELIRDQMYVLAAQMPCLAARQRWNQWCENAGIIEAYIRGNDVISKDLESMFAISLELARGSAPQRIIDWAQELVQTQARTTTAVSDKSGTTCAQTDTRL